MALLPRAMSFVGRSGMPLVREQCSGASRAMSRHWGKRACWPPACVSQWQRRLVATRAGEVTSVSLSASKDYDFLKQAKRFETLFVDGGDSAGASGVAKRVVPVTLLPDKASYEKWLESQPSLTQYWIKGLGNASFKSNRLVVVPTVVADAARGGERVPTEVYTEEKESEGQEDQEEGFISEVAYCLKEPDGLGSPFSLCPLYDQLPAGTYMLRGATGAALANPDAAALSWALGSYSFLRYKSKKSSGCSGKQEGVAEGQKTDGDGDGIDGEKTKQKASSSKVLVWPEGADRDRVSATAASTFLVRDLITTPCEDMGPQHLEDVLRSLAEEFGAVTRVVKGEDLLKAGDSYPMIHAVGRAAAGGREPRLLDFVWTPAGSEENLPKVTLVGKGVCFDTGGLVIKPAAGMFTMKKDMGGGAQVLGLARMVMSTRLPVRLRVLVPAVENAISSDAFRPGDVIVARDGKTTEIGNTDAEGRLVLADAFVDASSESPDLLIDCATLTGAARAALGTDLPVMFCNDDSIASRLQELSGHVFDQVWRLPLWEDYRKQLSSKVADLKNVGSGRFGGAIVAALYLEEFVGKKASKGNANGRGTVAEPDDGGSVRAGRNGVKLPWIHIDVMAFNQGSRPGKPEGGEAQGMRALFALLEDMFGAKKA